MSYEVFTDVNDLREWFETFSRNLIGSEKEFWDLMVKDARSGVANLAVERLPSGGQSVAHTIYSIPVVNEPGLKITDIKSSHDKIVMVEFGTVPHDIESNKLMPISPMLPQRGGGQANPETPPYGTRYGSGAMRLYRVKHPGARPFFIFRDTAKRINDSLNKMLSIMLNKAGFKD